MKKRCPRGRRNQTANDVLSRPMEGFAKPAQRLLDAAREVVEESGVHPFSVRTIAARAGQQPSAINYHFGDKEGLLVKLASYIIQDAELRLQARLMDIPAGPERTDVLFEDDRAMIHDTSTFRAILYVWAQTVRNDRLRSRMADLQRLYDEQNVRLFVTEPSAEQAKALAPYACLATAVTDGLSVQAAIRPDCPYLDEALGIWWQMLSVATDAVLRSVEAPDVNGSIQKRSPTSAEDIQDEDQPS